MALMNLFSGQQRRKRHKEWTYGQGGRRGGEGEMYGESNMEIKNTICENGNLLYDSGNSNRGSVTINKGGMGREMGGRLGKVGLWVYLWLILVMYDRKPQNSVKQFTFN